ncbi:hAT family C-terminal dimerization domain containing protein [Nitzschia inconspicua]|uniref:HAT family C-terminal dimerization domain containing protein n=1 Tax=Nitzschia inconspicua TaxID=303405 RepID=A0A9K3LBV6_9STRA|nr:hAT family C-terminal dimerization domain containing protein [Nitzschia inconspicua]
MVPFAVKKLRERLTQLASPQNTTTSRPLAQAQLRDFENRWRKATEPTFLGTVERGARDRQVGIHPAFLIASFLDPRSKDMVPDLGPVSERVAAIMVDQETKNREAQCLVAMGTDRAGATSTVDEEVWNWEKEDDFFADLEVDQARSRQGAEAHVGVGGNTVESIVQDELKRYKSFPPLQFRKVLPGGTLTFNDPLKWWEEKAPYFPIMSSLAKAYLGIQATSAPSERVFSAASMLIEKRRNRLDPELAGKMPFVAQNWDLHEKHLQDMLLAAAEQQEGEEVQGSEPPAAK